jgi:hypothetical protein
VTQDFVYQTVKRYKETCCIEKRKYPTRKLLVSTPAVIKTIRERIRHKCDRSARSMATALRANRDTIRPVLKNILGLSAYSKKRIRSAAAIQRRAK